MARSSTRQARSGARCPAAAFLRFCRRSIRANTHFRSSYAEDVTTPTTLPLYWRVCLINGAVFIAGTLALVLSPATISAEVLRSEAIVLSVGLTAILVTNALLLRTVLTPLAIGSAG